MTELKIGKWVRISVAPETGRTELPVDEGTIGVVERIAEATAGQNHYCVDGLWYFRDELAPVLRYAELERQRADLLEACESALYTLEHHRADIWPGCGEMRVETQLKNAIAEAKGATNA